MQQIGQRIGGLVGPPCVAAKLADSKPATKEFDPECVVEESVPGGARKVYGRCKAGGARPCWDLTADTTCSASGYRIDIDRAGQMPAPGTQQTFRCLTETVK
jgi:hypothetical protein